jgi:hypothetical protein
MQRTDHLALFASSLSYRTVSAKGVVDSSQQWDMKLTISAQLPSPMPSIAASVAGSTPPSKLQEQVIDLVINRSKRDMIKEKLPKATSTTPGSDKRTGELKSPSAGLSTPPPSRPSDERLSEKTLDFTFVVMFAVTLSIIFILHDLVQLPWLVHPTFVALVSFVMGAMTYAYSGPFKEWISVTTLNRLTSKPKVKKP